ncbi:MAG: MCE family protein [Elusimicrobia bacterium]|nr:MCE family protein [Elusimicrobiota bacterium]
MEYKKSDALIGAFIVFSVIVFLVILAAMNRHRFAAKTYPIEIHLPDITGIDKGVDVIYKGFKAGSVDHVSIVYKPEFRFIVTLEIKKEIRLRSGTIVMVKSKGLASAKYLELMPPPEGSEGEIIPAGSVMPTAQDMDLSARAHQVMGDLQKFVKDFQKAGTTDKLRQTLELAHSVIENLDALLANTNAAVAENRAALRAGMEHLEGVTSKTLKILEARDAAMMEILENMRGASSHSPSIAVHIEELMADVKRHPWKFIRKGKEDNPPALDHRHEPVLRRSTTTPKVQN